MSTKCAFTYFAQLIFTLYFEVSRLNMNLKTLSGLACTSCSCHNPTQPCEVWMAIEQHMTDKQLYVQGRPEPSAIVNIWTLAQAVGILVALRMCNGTSLPDVVSGSGWTTST